MKNSFALLLFIFGSLIMLGAAYIDEYILIASATVFAISGLYLTYLMAIKKYVYTSVLFGFHVGMSFFTTYIFFNENLVIKESVFDFSTFTSENLQLVIFNLVSASLIIYGAWHFFGQRSASFVRASAKTIVYELIGSLEKIPLIGFYISLILSFSLALVFFMTNASVLEISYPSQSRMHWVSWELMKLPTFMAVSAVGIAYARKIQRSGYFAIWLRLAQANFLAVTIMMILLTGSRGMFTFLWLFIGIFELFLWKKRRGSLAWSLLFIGLSWLAYQSWPYMRTALSSFPFMQVLEEALLIGFGLGGDSESMAVDTAQIRLNDMPMIGQSLFHFLYVVELIKNGVSLGGETFINLFLQILPDFLDGVLWARPLNDNWKLGEYYSHGGGFLVIANAYWNGGTWVAMPFMALLASLFVWFDRQLSRPSSSVIYRAVYWLWLPVMFVQLGYGIQGLSRVIEILLFIIIIQKFVRKKKKHAIKFVSDSYGKNSEVRSK